MNMHISIAMASYNGAKYLREQLDSFVYQTRQPDELVVCDDGSTDGTLEILEAFRQEVPFPVHIHRNEKNLGYVKNFEKTSSLCVGDIIFLSDQDDVWFCSKIETMVKILMARGDTFVVQTDSILTDEYMNPSRYTQFENIRALGHNSAAIVFGCGSAIRKAWLDLALPISLERTGHDNWIHRLAVALEVRVLHEMPLQYYRRHSDNASNWHASKLARMTDFESLRVHGFRDASEGWKGEFDRVKATWIRIAENGNTLNDLGLADRLPSALSALNDQMRALDTRIHKMTMSRLKRLPSVIAMWMRGDYRHFAGWKSLIKDIVRP